MWISLFSRKSQRVGKQFLTFLALFLFIVIVVVIVFVNIVVVVVVRGGVIGATVSISRLILRVSSLLFSSFSWTNLIVVMSRFSTVVARWFGSVSIRVCFMLAHSVSLWFIRSF